MALASISILSLLPLYHRSHDAKLLLLMIPACSMLWARRGATRWTALGLTLAAIFVTSDVPDILLSSATKDLRIPQSTLAGKLTLLAIHPEPLVLLAAACFYLWVHLRCHPSVDVGREEESGIKAVGATAAG